MQVLISARLNFKNRYFRMWALWVVYVTFYSSVTFYMWYFVVIVSSNRNEDAPMTEQRYSDWLLE